MNDLTRFFPKGGIFELENLHPDEIERLQQLALSKAKAPPKRTKERVYRDGEPMDARKTRSDGNFVVGDDKQGTKITRFLDSPLDRMFNRDAIGGTEYAALQKYKHHWHHAGLESQLGSADLGRIFSSDPGSMSGMAKTERQAHHRKQYREAREAVGHRTGIVVDNVVCAEHGLEVAGYAIGWTNKPQAIAAATEMLRDAGYRLARLWGIG